MIELKKSDDYYEVSISGKEIEILDADDDYVLAECELPDLDGVAASDFPDRLRIEIRSENGFGTYFFHELTLAKHNDGIALDFFCHTPNKYWEGRFGLATFLNALNRQTQYVDNLEVTHLETEDDWKGITIRRSLSKGDPITPSIISAAEDLKHLLSTTEISLSGVYWKKEYETDEDLILPRSDCSASPTYGLSIRPLHSREKRIWERFYFFRSNTFRKS